MVRRFLKKPYYQDKGTSLADSEFISKAWFHYAIRILNLSRLRVTLQTTHKGTLHVNSKCPELSYGANDYGASKDQT